MNTPIETTKKLFAIEIYKTVLINNGSQSIKKIEFVSIFTIDCEPLLQTITNNVPNKEITIFITLNKSTVLIFKFSNGIYQVLEDIDKIDKPIQTYLNAPNNLNVFQYFNIALQESNNYSATIPKLEKMGMIFINFDDNNSVFIINIKDDTLMNKIKQGLVNDTPESFITCFIIDNNSNALNLRIDDQNKHSITLGELDVNHKNEQLQLFSSSKITDIMKSKMNETNVESQTPDMNIKPETGIMNRGITAAYTANRAASIGSSLFGIAKGLASNFGGKTRRRRRNRKQSRSRKIKTKRRRQRKT